MSQRATFFASDDCPPVASRDELPAKANSDACLLWHWVVCNARAIHVRRLRGRKWMMYRYVEPQQKRHTYEER